MNDGRLEDSAGNRYQLLEGGHIGKFSPVKLTDESILSPHEGVKPAEVGVAGKADKAPVAAPKEASAPAQKSVEDTPEMKEAKAQISSAARSALASFVSKSYEDLAAIPNLAATIAAEVTSRVRALNSDVIAFVPLVKGAIVVQTNKGNVAVSGTVAYAKRLLAAKEGQSKDKAA